MTTAELTGPQKAALMVIQMGSERSASVLMHLSDTDIEELMSEVARLHDYTIDDVDDVMTEFKEVAESHSFMGKGGLDFAREVLAQSFGDQKAEEIIERLQVSSLTVPFEFLRRADARQVISYIQDEHPQLIALVIAHLPPSQSAAIVSALPERLQAEVAQRIALMERTSPDVITKVENVLKAKLSSVLQSNETSSAGGVNRLVDILNRAERTTERTIFEGLDTNDPDLAEEIRSRMFVFDDIQQLDQRAIQLVLKHVDTKDLGTALKGTQSETQESIFKNLSQRAADNLREEMELMGPVRMKTVEEAQGVIIRTIRKLEDEGQIVVTRGGEDFVT